MACFRLHRLDAVAHEIDDELLHLHAIGPDRWQVDLQVRIDAHVSTGRFVAHQAAHFPDDIVEVQLRPGQIGPPEQGADAAHHLGRGVGVANGSLGRETRSFDTGRIGGQPALAGVPIGDQRGQRLAQLMRDRSSQLGDGGHCEARERSACVARSASSVRLRSSMSICTPYQWTIRPSIVHRLAMYLEPSIRPVRASHCQ